MGANEVLPRCPWVPLNDPLYVEYHDNEWGVPVHDDRLLFEFLTLEGFQAGLSWRTILYKRENFRSAFDNFIPSIIANYDEDKIRDLLDNPGIVRNRLKIAATVNNAQLFIKLQHEFGNFDTYIWSFVDRKPIQSNLRSLADYPARTSISDNISKDLKQRGFRFVGSTIIYAHMQATGMVNDHTIDCFRCSQLEESTRAGYATPGSL